MVPPTAWLVELVHTGNGKMVRWILRLRRKQRRLMVALVPGGAGTRCTMMALGPGGVGAWWSWYSLYNDGMDDEMNDGMDDEMTTQEMRSRGLRGWSEGNQQGEVGAEATNGGKQNDGRTTPVSLQ
jgi:hypothetical protein